jgi:hypothetical protein
MTSQGWPRSSSDRVLRVYPPGLKCLKMAATMAGRWTPGPDVLEDEADDLSSAVVGPQAVVHDGKKSAGPLVIRP